MEFSELLDDFGQMSPISMNYCNGLTSLLLTIRT